MEVFTTPPTDLISARLILLRELVESLELSQIALTHNDAERIARGAARQAELCRQWGALEDLRSSISPKSAHRISAEPQSHSSSEIEEEFSALTARIRHLTRVHCSLLRHLQRSLSILAYAMQSCAPTYAPVPDSLRIDARPQAGD